MDDIVRLKVDLMDRERKEDEDEDTPNRKGQEPETDDDLELFVRQWEKDFDRSNQNPEENSDFDSDNEINPLDGIDKLTGKYRSTQSISSENAKKQKPIQLSIVGKPNIGKSTFVNSLLKEHRVVANDMPGTTRDCV